MLSISEFEAARPQLTAIAFRFLGSIHDAEDAVQSTWIKASSAATEDVRNPAAWLTTALTRTCIDQLRARDRRREDPYQEGLPPAEALAADEKYLLRENVSRAMMVVLDVLTPPQRVAYVLHDLFDVPFGDVADVLDITADSAKKHASRARRRIDRCEPPTTADSSDAVVDAFLLAAAGGDIDSMLALLAEDCVRVADAGLLPPGAPTRVTGARAVARETSSFRDRIRASTPLLVDGRRVHVIAPGGHPFAIVVVSVDHGRVTSISIDPPS